MAYVTVPKDLDKVKNKVVFNLTFRQVVCIGIAAGIGAPFYFATKDVIGSSNAATGMVALMLPVFFFALYEKDGLPLEKVLMNVINVKFIRPAEREYRTSDVEKNKIGAGIPTTKEPDRRKEKNKIHEPPGIFENSSEDDSSPVFPEEDTEGFDPLLEKNFEVEDAKTEDDESVVNIVTSESDQGQQTDIERIIPSEKQLMILSFETEGGEEDRPISEEHILKEMAGSLNRLNDEGSRFTSLEIEKKGEAIFEPKETMDSAQTNLIKYEPLTTHEAYLNDLLESMAGGGDSV